jgi:uncharacterized protein YndB with AHSA1/START domain
MNAKEPESASDREIVLTRVVDAPRALVWRIWTEPSEVVRWWGPTGFSTRSQEMEVRPGGRWRFTMIGPDGREYPNLITYLEVEAPARLVYEHGGEVGLEPVSFRTIVTLEELGASQTRVTLRSIFPSAKMRDFVVREYGAIEGGKQHLARLAERAAELSGGAPSEASRPHAGRDFVIHRVLEAPRALVWEVWTDVDHLARWFGPKECMLDGCTLDLRPGGRFLYRMRPAQDTGIAGAPEHWGKWVFREIVPQERLVFEVSFADASGETVRAPFEETWPLRMLSTVTFEDHAGKGRGTVVTVRWSALDATSEEQRTFDRGHDSMREGWTGTLDKLVEHLRSAKTSGRRS